MDRGREDKEKIWKNKKKERIREFEWKKARFVLSQRGKSSVRSVLRTVKRTIRIYRGTLDVGRNRWYLSLWKHFHPREKYIFKSILPRPNRNMELIDDRNYREDDFFRRRREFREKFTIIRSIPHLREKLGRAGFLTEARRKIIRILSIDVVFEIVAPSKQSRNVETNSDTFRRINYNLPLLSFQTSRTTLSIWKTLRMRERRNGKGLGRYTPDEGQVLARRN